MSSLNTIGLGHTKAYLTSEDRFCPILKFCDFLEGEEGLGLVGEGGVIL